MLPLTTCTDQKAHCQPLHVGRYVEGKGESPRTGARRTTRGHLVIRFSSIVVNKGPGRLELVGSRPNTKTPDLKLAQNVYQTDGHIRRVPTRAVAYYEHADGHQHFHVQAFEEMRLRAVGSRTWRNGHKEGFCVGADYRLVRNVGERQLYDDCGDGKPNLLAIKERLAPGWVDDYSWYLWGQYINLDGLKLPGNFCLSATVDPKRMFLETTRSNNTASTLVHITATGATVIRQGC